MRSRYAVLLLAGAGAFAASVAHAQPASPQEFAQARTEHFRIRYPEGQARRVDALLGSAEKVYAEVDSIFGRALPEVLELRFVVQGVSRSDSAGVVLSLAQEPYLDRILARELTRAACRTMLGPRFGTEGYRFLIEGSAAWVEERYERRRDSVAPRRMWAAYGFMQEAAHLEYLEAFSRASEEQGSRVATAIAYTFVASLIERYGSTGLSSLFDALRGGLEVCTALDDLGLGCQSFVSDWHAALESEAARHDFSRLPDIQADLYVGGEAGEMRDLTLWVRIRNPETDHYLYFVSYVIDGRPGEAAYPGVGREFEARVPIGEAAVGSKVLWDVAVWSRSLQLWRRSGWQDRTVE